MLHPVLNDAIETLLTVWRRYDDVIKSRADHGRRAAARAQLDVERLRVHRLRRGLHPELRGLEEVAFGCPCGSVVDSSLLDRIE